MKSAVCQEITQEGLNLCVFLIEVGDYKEISEGNNFGFIA